MRLLVISNRLPITVGIKGDKLVYHESTGGLVSGLSAYLNSLKSSSFTKTDYVWVGWPGLTIGDEFKDELKSTLYTKFHAYPVFLDENMMDMFYHGFCNKTLWPLFHYFPSYASYEDEFWKCYIEVNRIFCDSLMEIIEPDDVVWIHDYHLMLLPRLVKDKFPDIPIGFFLHIPFPCFEIFRLLPRKCGKHILEHLLGADLIGFHTHDYTQYFLGCVLRILGHDHDMGKFILENRIVKADTFPMGIDFQKYHSTALSKQVKKGRKKLEKKLSCAKVILSVDRLDYTKGIINRLKGFELFLEKNPQYYNKAVLILLVVPSRIGVEHYQMIKKQIEELVGKINGRFGSINWTPILYQYKYEPLNQLVSLYSLSDIALITPLRDGMNLVAKEYVASQTGNTGVLILSEMTGAAKELGEAVLINPNNIDEIVSALKEAFEMPADEQNRRLRIMQNRLKRYNVVRWADDFIQKLISQKKESQKLYLKLLDSFQKERVLEDYKNSKKRLIFLDYDGTLVPFQNEPLKAKPDKEIIDILTDLADNFLNTLVLISGRERTTMTEWFSSVNLDLVAEHGAWIKGKKEKWKISKVFPNEWKSQIFPILEMYTDRLPGSLIEEKEFAYAWHYRASDPELSSIREKELLDDLVHFTANNPNIQVLKSNKVIEVRSAGIDKGSAALHWLSKGDYDFILAIGDDLTDEDLFKALPENSFTIKVGTTQSHAKFYLNGYMEVRNLLKEFLK